MKKTIVILLLLGLEMFGTQLQAEFISSENLSTATLRNVLSENYGTKIEDDEITVSTASGKIFLKVISLKKVKILRFEAFYSKYDKWTIQELISLANKWNDSKRFLRVSIDPKDGSSTCDYYLICVKGIDGENVIASMEWFVSLQNRWAEFVINNGKTTDE